jgi:hypothetical protein
VSSRKTTSALSALLFPISAAGGVVNAAGERFQTNCLPANDHPGSTRDWRESIMLAAVARRTGERPTGECRDACGELILPGPNTCACCVLHKHRFANSAACPCPCRWGLGESRQRSALGWVRRFLRQAPRDPRCDACLLASYGSVPYVEVEHPA